MAGVHGDTFVVHTKEYNESKFSMKDDDETEEVNDSPIEQVRLTVPITDDPSQPVLTFRTWVIGLGCCIVLAFVNQFFTFRTTPLYVSTVAAQIVSLPMGKLMAATLPTTIYKLPFFNWSFTLNPGPFSLKEHVLITIFAACGGNSAFAINIVVIVKAFYKRSISPIAALLLAMTTQMLGYGWAGIFRKFLVESPYMWWPTNLVQVSLFSAFHEKEHRPKGGNTRLQFFFLVFIASFTYYTIPGYFFQSLSTISVVCLIWKKSVTAQQLGSGMKGLGIGSFTLDWNTVAGFLQSPLPVPGFAIINILAGFFIVLYIVIPITYWNNFYEAKKFPMISSHTFDSTGAIYNVSRVLNQKSFGIDLDGYNNYSKLYLSIIFAFDYGLSFATITSTISHVFLFHGKEILLMWRQTTATLKEQAGDVHTRIMKKNYAQVPEWWFLTILVLMIILALVCCEGFDKQLQLPWWGVLLSLVIALVFTLPVGVIQATTNIQPGLSVTTELIFGYLYPGKPLANVAFMTYGYVSMAQALTFIGDFKLGHYMKIPPRSMFAVQLVGTVVAATVNFVTAWWLLTSIPNICNPALLPKGSPWTCPGGDVFYNNSIIWGVIGPQRMFAKDGIYPGMNWFFLIGILSPVLVWLLARKYPNHKWIKLIQMPLIFAGGSCIPPVRAVNFLSWGVVGIFFNFYIYKKYKTWWARHTYILSAAMDAGIAFMGVLLFFALQNYDIFGPAWWGLEGTDHCPLATCPTAPGIKSEGCPTF